MKYKIELICKVEGPVEEKDIIGSIFNNLRDLFEWNLEDLIKKKKISKIRVVKDKDFKIVFFSNLDKKNTALIVASIENINKVGPFHARIKLLKIEDLREKIKEKILERAKEILSMLDKEYDFNLIYKDGFIMTDKTLKYDEIIIVEGKRDLLNLTKNFIYNVVAVNGIINSERIKKLKKLLNGKKIILMLDRDRGGLFIKKLLQNYLDIDFIIILPRGKKVEELTRKEIINYLKNKMDLKEIKKELINKEKEAKQLAYFLNKSK